MVEDLVKRYFDVEDKLIVDPTQLNLINTVAKSEAGNYMRLRATSRIENEIRVEGKLLRRNVQIEEPSQVGDSVQTTVSYCVDNSEIRAFHKDGSSAKLRDATLEVELTVKRFPDQKWYAIDERQVEKKC